MKRHTSLALALAAGAAAAIAPHARAQTVINITGATLFESFFLAPASTNDYIDLDGDGVARIFSSFDQLAPGGALPYPGQGSGANAYWWTINYRETGSVAGLQELISYGSTFVTSNDQGEIRGNISKAFLDRTQYINNGVPFGAAYNSANPGGSPIRSNTSTLQATYTPPGVASPGGIRIDIAPLDVPTLWGVQNAGTPAFTANPGQPGYGTNPRISVNRQGLPAGAGFANTLANLGPRNLYDPNNPGGANANTIFDSPVAAVPIAVMTNLGTGRAQIDQSALRHLFATGRLPSGENLVAVTRESGSGTRNGFCNSLGLDPSFGVGENVGGLAGSGGSVLASEHQLGPDFVPGNKGGSGDMENTVFNHRLAIGYTGAERAVSGSSSGSWLTSRRAEMLSVRFDLIGGVAFARPNISALLDNNPAAGGYCISGTEQFATIGDPLAAPVAKGGDANGHPPIANVEAAAYINNITRSVAAFSSAPTDPENLFTPGEFLATKFVFVAATDYVHSPASPNTWIPNPAFNQPLQDYIRASTTIYGQAAYQSFGTQTLNGKVPTRKTGITYSDGVAGGQTYYLSQGGAQLLYGSDLPMRNRIAGDFNGDGLRNLNDATEMMRAYYSRNAGPTWTAPAGTGPIAGAPGADAAIEILGDFNGDGNFTAADIRYWADGLALDPATGNLNRAAGFLAVDNAWQTLTGSSNFFATTIAGGRPYAPGNSAADVAGAPGIAPGWAPVGADGVIDAQDVAYITAQKNTVGAAAHWATTAEAVRFDLSADVTGDLIVDQADIDAADAILGTPAACYPNCDASTVPPILNVLDFNCFLNNFAAGNSYANCDASTVPPILNVLDFNCFLNRFAAGCP